MVLNLLCVVKLHNKKNMQYCLHSPSPKLAAALANGTLFEQIADKVAQHCQAANNASTNPYHMLSWSAARNAFCVLLACKQRTTAS